MILSRLDREKSKGLHAEAEEWKKNKTRVEENLKGSKIFKGTKNWCNFSRGERKNWVTKNILTKFTKIKTYTAYRVKNLECIGK